MNLTQENNPTKSDKITREIRDKFYSLVSYADGVEAALVLVLEELEKGRVSETKRLNLINKCKNALE